MTQRCLAGTVSAAFQNVVCKQAVSAKGFHERPQRKRQDTSVEGDSTTQAQLRQMQHRLKYLEQEVEFLKKNILSQKYTQARAAAMNEPSTVFSLIHQTLSGSENESSVSMMCRTAGVSRSGYYAWSKAASARQIREAQDRADFELVLEAYDQRGHSKGARGIHMCLIHNIPPMVMNLKKIRRSMKRYGLHCPIRRANPYRKMKNAMKTNNYAPNLLDRGFECYGPRLVLLTDITHIPWGGSFLYLCVIMDAYTKQVLSYTLSPSLEVDFVLDAVDSLMLEHDVSLHTETVIHSDQGCHYTSCKSIELVERNDLRRL